MTHEFRILWQKSAGGRWHVRSVKAETLGQALDAVLQRIRKNLGLKDSEFHVDHFVQEFVGGQQQALHTLTAEPRDFQVHYKNKPWPPGATIDT